MFVYENKYPHLFSPIVLGNTMFRSRIFASPTGCAWTNGDGYLNDEAIAYYSRKAKGGAASVATFQGFVDGEYGTMFSQDILLDRVNIEQSLITLAHSIKAYGAVASLELQHVGMYANYKTDRPGYGPVECEFDGRHALAMSEEMIERTIRKFADGARLAKRCGYGMVTIHGGHGWLLHQFFSPLTNTRTDKWGGPEIENRARLAIEICKAIRKACGPGFPIELRISASECTESGYGLDTGIEISKAIDGYVDLIHVSACGHLNQDEIVLSNSRSEPGLFLEEGPYLPFAAEIKKHVKTPVAVVGGLTDPAMMEDIIASGKADVVEMARALMCDPDLPIKARAGRDDEIRKCMRCLTCLSNRVTTMRSYCAINPECARDGEMRYDIPPAVKKKVLVVGGGVGGMQAALTCASRGHEVILCEKGARLGGVLRCEEDVSFKKDLDRYLNQQEALIDKSDIDVRLNTEVTPDYVSEVAPDVLIAALGAVPRKPPIPGIDGENVLCAQDAYVSLDKIGQNVLVLGAGLVGVELAIHLKRNGRNVQIVEMLDHMSDGGNVWHMWGVQGEMNRLGLKVDFNTTVKEVKPNRAVCVCAGEEHVYEFDTFIYSVGQIPARDEALALGERAPEFHMIGDCIASRNIASATGEAFMISRNLGRC